MKQIYKCDYVAADMKSAINVYGEVFAVGEIVTHQDKSAGSATIQRFAIADDGDILAHTDKGVASLPFLEKKDGNNGTK